MNNICQSCKQPKRVLKTTRSSLLDFVVLHRCQACINAGMQPRWLLIMAARKNGAATVKEQINERLYVGKEITLREIS